IPMAAGAKGETKVAATANISSPRTEDHLYAVEHIPTLADTILRAGRAVLRNTAARWDPYLRLRESKDGLHFSFTNALGTVFEGISRRVSLDGLRLRFSGLQNYNGTKNHPTTFAICFGKGEYERFGFGLILDPVTGTIRAAQSSGSALVPVGEALLESPLLTASALKDTPWTLTLSKEFDHTYTLTADMNGAGLSSSIPATVVEQGDYDPTDCCFGIMAQEGRPTFDLTLNGWAQLPRPVAPKLSETLLTGTGNYEGTLSDWSKWLTVTEDAQGLTYRFTDAAHSVTEAMFEPVSLKGLRIYFSDLATTVPEQNGRFAVTFGTGSLVRSCFGLIFDFKAGRVYAANAEVSNGTVSTSRVAVVGSPLFSGSAFTYAALAGKQWYIDFSHTSEGSYNLTICIEGTAYDTVIPSSVVCAYEGFSPDRCFLHLMSAQNGTTLDLQLEGIVNRYPEQTIDNSDLLPAHVPVTEKIPEGYGTPEWFKSAMMMEVNIPRITKEGTLDAAVSVLDHIAETGINCIWLTSLCEPGTTNDGKPGNHYTNKGVQTIDPALTGTTDYEQGWKKLANFVEEAHKRNIYVIFNVITWGTTADSPLYREHPDWYTGANLWNGKAWDWNNAELRAWFQKTLVDIVTKTNVDGVLYDCEPQYAGSSICAQHRAAIRATGRNPVVIAETVNERSNAFDMELYGVMDYSNYTETWLAIGDHQKDDREFFIDEGNNIVDAVKNGTISGTPAQQKAGTGGQYQYYSYSFSNHDSYYYGIKNNLLDVAYQGIFSSYIPIWCLGEEIHSTNSGIRLYFDQTNWAQLTLKENRDFFEQLKSLIRIRREYNEVFEQMPANHRRTNICKVETSGSLDLQAYGRYYDNTGIMIVGNHNAEGKAVSTTVAVPFGAMGLNQYDHFIVTDLRSGQILCQGSREDVAYFGVQIPYDDLGVYAVEGMGTFAEGLTVANTEHALLRNGTAHQINTATVNWAPYVQVTQAPFGKGLRFSFTKAVATTGEGINVPVSLDSLRISLDELKGYVNNGSAADPATIALSFGAGGYERNGFGLVFDFANGRVYAARTQEGTADRFVKDTAPLLDHECLKASSLQGKPWDITIEKQPDGTYILSLTVESTLLQGTIPAGYIRKTQTFDPSACYLYFTSYSQSPTVSLDLLGWGQAGDAYTPFGAEAIHFVNNGTTVTVNSAPTGTGLRYTFRGARPFEGGYVNTRLNLDGTTLYFDDLTSYRDYLSPTGNTKFALGFRTDNDHPYDLAIVMDPVYGSVTLALRGVETRRLLANGNLSYGHLRDVQWTMGFLKQADGSYLLRLQLPDGTYETVITEEDLATIPEFDPENCALSLLSWQGDLKLSLTLLGYTGEKEPKPLENTAWKIGHTLNLASDISVNFAVNKALLSGVDPRSVYAITELDTYEGNLKTGTRLVKLLPVEQGDYYYFTLEGLTAVNMNDELRTVVYGTVDGVARYSPVDTYSIATYAYSQLNTSGRPQSLKNLCAELLRYGTKAQIFKSYRLDALADSAMTPEQRAYLTDPDTVTFGNTDTVLTDLENAPIKWEGKALDLASKVSVKLIFSMGFYTGELADLTLRVR
ncbi:MAG: hypothetical protein IKM59_02645, partial [Oscillospiraceae bacterium]|nr:hypothetical protein [Oscillospiraceae bacterium]